MPGHKKRRSRKKGNAGWVNNRFITDTNPTDLYPLKRAEEMSSEEEEYVDIEDIPAGSGNNDEKGEAPEEKLHAVSSEKTAKAPEEAAAKAPAAVTAEAPAELTAEAHAEKAAVVSAEKTGDAPLEKAAEAPGEKTAEVPALSRRERFRRFWTKERIEILRMVIRTAIAGFFAILFLMPIVLTITNSLMTKSEINANYGVIFAKRNGVRVFISNTVNLKFIPDIVSFEQYFKVLILSPEYLLKFWNSVIYVVPIVTFQLAIASLASYGFARYRGRVREVIFFAYIILMLMPYQVTLVPNYLVSSWLNILNTRWAIWLPGFFSPFAVYMLTKYMRRIPKSIYEAAEIDGAGEWQIFTKICLPNCRGGIASIAILLFIDYWNMVEQPLILLSNDQLHPLSVFLSKINSGEISLAFAVAVIYMVLPMMVFLYGEEYLVEGIVYQGGIKE